MVDDDDRSGRSGRMDRPIDLLGTVLWLSRCRVLTVPPRLGDEIYAVPTMTVIVNILNFHLVQCCTHYLSVISEIPNPIRTTRIQGKRIIAVITHKKTISVRHHHRFQKRFYLHPERGR